LLTIFVKIEMC